MVTDSFQVAQDLRENDVRLGFQIPLSKRSMCRCRVCKYNLSNSLSISQTLFASMLSLYWKALIADVNVQSVYDHNCANSWIAGTLNETLLLICSIAY